MQKKIFWYTALFYINTKKKMNIPLDFICDENDCPFELPANMIDCFFQTGKSICQLEAQSFLSDERNTLESSASDETIMF